jgi:hypothetical protein
LHNELKQQTLKKTKSIYEKNEAEKEMLLVVVKRAFTKFENKLLLLLFF